MKTGVSPYIGEVNLQELACVPFGISFSTLGFDFIQDGIHMHGGGDYIVSREGHLLGRLCWTINKENRRRAAWTPEGKDPDKHSVLHYSDDPIEVITWLTGLLSAKA